MPQVCEIEVAETVVITKFTEAQQVQMELAKNQSIGNRDGTVQATQALTDLGLQILDCVVPTCMPWFWVYVRNVQPKNVNLNKFKRIGKNCVSKSSCL